MIRSIELVLREDSGLNGGRRPRKRTKAIIEYVSRMTLRGNILNSPVSLVNTPEHGQTQLIGVHSNARGCSEVCGDAQVICVLTIQEDILQKMV